mmetsp:Transcript_21331/g.68158  ORF Transcript_21331/g.68158 Transcript_21331/m.68158 type:complete len:189 (+) Transcript_21331:83-649(+)
MSTTCTTAAARSPIGAAATGYAEAGPVTARLCGRKPSGPASGGNYTSTRVLLYGRSRQHSAAVILLLQNSRGCVEPISESRDVGDSSVAAIAMRGVAEELLGASKAGQPGFSHGQTISLLRRLDANGRVLRHLGRRPEATHRSFVLRADHIFEGGIDVAVARFQANDEAVGSHSYLSPASPALAARCM